MRSSVEGLNQEIERLVLKSGVTQFVDKSQDYDKVMNSLTNLKQVDNKFIIKKMIAVLSSNT